MLEKESLNFSFSGLKAAVFRLIDQEQKNSKILSEKFKQDLCASFEQIMLDTFTKKIDRALDQYPEVQTVSFVGGVSANTFLRENLKNFCERSGKKFWTTVQFEYSTDNASMIASAAYFLMQKNPNIASIQHIDAVSNLAL